MDVEKTKFAGELLETGTIKPLQEESSENISDSNTIKEKLQITDIIQNRKSNNISKHKNSQNTQGYKNNRKSKRNIKQKYYKPTCSEKNGKLVSGFVDNSKIDDTRYNSTNYHQYFHAPLTYSNLNELNSIYQDNNYIQNYGYMNTHLSYQAYNGSTLYQNNIPYTRPYENTSQQLNTLYNHVNLSFNETNNSFRSNNGIMNTTSQMLRTSSGTSWEDLQNVLNQYDKMVAMGEQPDAFTYSTLFKACGNRNPPACDTANGLWIDMLSMGVNPNVVVINSIISVFAASGDLLRAEYYIDQMSVFNIKPDLQTYNSVLYACSENKPKADLERAGFWFSQLLLNPDLKPDAYTFNSLINTAAKVNNADIGFEFYLQIEKYKIPPNIQTLTSVIKLCAKVGNINKAVELFESAQKQGLIPDTIMWNSLLNVCSKCGDFERGFKLWEKMKDSDNHPDAASANSLFDICGQSGNYERLVGVMKEAEEMNIKLNEYSFPALINGCVRAGDAERAFRWFHLFKNSLPWNKIAICTLFRLLDEIYTKNSTKDKSKYDQIVDSTSKLDDSKFVIKNYKSEKIKNLLRKQYFEMSQRIFSEAVDRGLFFEHLLNSQNVLLLAGLPNVVAQVALSYALQKIKRRYEQNQTVSTLEIVTGKGKLRDHIYNYCFMRNMHIKEHIRNPGRLLFMSGALIYTLDRVIQCEPDLFM